MKKLITLILFLGLYLTSNAQIIRFVDYKYQSDVKIFFVKHKYQADGIVYMTPYKFQARNMMCFWYDGAVGWIHKCQKLTFQDQYASKMPKNIAIGQVATEIQPLEYHKKIMKSGEFDLFRVVESLLLVHGSQIDEKSMT